MLLLVGLVLGGGAGAGGVYYLNKGTADGGGKPAVAGTDPKLKSGAAELDLLPPDALAFVHLRAAELGHAEAFADFRTILAKAGPAVLKGFDDSFPVAPSSVDRVTVVVAPLDPDDGEPAFAVLVALSADADPAAVRKAYLPGAVRKAVGGGEVWTATVDGSAVALHAAGPRLLVVGRPKAVEWLLAPRDKKATDPLAAAKKLAADGGRHLLVGLNVGGIPNVESIRKAIPDEYADFRPLAAADTATLGLLVTTAGEFKLDARLTYKDEAAAGAAEGAVRKAADKGRDALKPQREKLRKDVAGPNKNAANRARPMAEFPEAVGALFGLSAMNSLDEFLQTPPVKKDGRDLTAVVTLPALISGGHPNGPLVYSGIVFAAYSALFSTKGGDAPFGPGGRPIDIPPVGVPTTPRGGLTIPPPPPPPPE